ncbi:MAG TPA: GAF domain-containing protein [Aquihabitans sp.]|nr:GAF domain-containing protein [Aquihabitans sp.]
MSATEPLGLDDLTGAFEGAIPAVLVTASAAGVPNVTYLSKVHRVDAERIALSNQFLSKSARNLVENPQASLLLVEPNSQDEYRLALVYERTERRGPVFDRLRADIDHLAALTGLQHVFRLQAADVYRVVEVEAVRVHGDEASGRLAPGTAPLGELGTRIARCGDLDTLVRTAVDGIADLLGYRHAMLLLVDEDGDRLFTIASHGYDAEGIGSEVVVGEGLIGMAAAQCTAVRVGNLRQMTRYSRRVRQSFEGTGAVGPGLEIPVPGLPDANSRIAVPAMALGRLVGVVVVESSRPADFDDDDAAALQVVASLVAGSIEGIRAEERSAEAALPTRRTAVGPPAGPSAHVRFFPVDGSTFIDGDYLIKGVAGRILWSLLGQHAAEGRIDFTNKEVRLDPTLDLPDFRDNFESRLILLKRRLDERQAPVRIEKTGRGRFRLQVAADLRLEAKADGA